MLYPVSILSIILLALIHLTSGHQNHTHITHSPHHYSYTNDTIPFSTRAFWMRRANAALGELDSPCPFAAFGTVIVNHTDLSEGPRGKAVCYGVNSNRKTGNPTLHGEMAGINNCSTILTDPEGEYKLSPAEALLAFSTLSLYTNAEPCPMCASAIRWSGFSECIFGTSISTLIEKGWGQIDIAAEEVFEKSGDLSSSTKLLKEVLTNETDPYFLWQYDETYPCPKGCERTSSGSSCAVVAKKRAAWEL
ncbi:cytidine deaminase-like protein [Cadophora sp. DSE1049]|nr:cytidine deaminase-like protein [Cadophora sp. DSE1049]